MTTTPDTQGVSPYPKPRNAYIDGLRGWSIFGVVCIHFGGSFVNSSNAWSPSFYLGLILNQGFSFAVPLFVFFSGYLASLSKKTPRSLWGYYRSRFWRIIFPYFIASTAAFFFLNHYNQWSEITSVREQITWLFQRVFYYGVEPTMYFIPLIILLYLVQPILKALPSWCHRLVPRSLAARFTLDHTVLLLMLIFLALHISLGVLTYTNRLNYYDWARPNPLFWAFYFYSGLHFRSLSSFTSRRFWVWGSIVALVITAVVMIKNGLYLTDRTAVGALFERSIIDYAYVRPEILIYDLAMVFCLSSGIALAWNWQQSPFSFLGRYTLEIYLWHILVLYYGAWQFAETLEACKQVPELIVIICAATCWIIAGLFHWFPRLLNLIRQHRLVIIKLDKTPLGVD